MGTRLLIVLVVIIVLLAVLAMVLGANRKSPTDEEKDVKSGNAGMAPLLESAFGWMSPRFDLSDLVVEGANLDREKRSLTLQQNQKVTLRVKMKPDAGPNDCRSLTLALTSPQTGDHGSAVLLVDKTSIFPPMPKGAESPKPGQFLPVPPPPPDEKPTVSLDTRRNPRACAIPVFRNGATIVLVAQQACTVEIR